MILNLGSLAFNANIKGGGGTPTWGTELGQGQGYRFNFEDSGELLTSMLYMSVEDITNVTCPLGKGGGRRDDYEFVVASLYDKIYVNGIHVKGAKFLLLIVKQVAGEYHIGRRSIKYSPRITYNGFAYNEACYKLIPQTLGISSEAAWFIDEIYTLNQDELHFVAYVLNESGEKEYQSNEERKKDFLSKINAEKESNKVTRRLSSICTSEYSLQKISYGAPGTGKSNGIKQYFTENNIDEKTQVIRTTFHPDSDYSTFVGAYKPTMEKKEAKQPILNFADLVDKLKEYKQQQHDNATLACTKFGFDYHDSLKNIREDKNDNILNLVKAVYDPHNSLDTNVRAGKIIGEGLSEELYEEKIVYKFVPQAFLKAYVAAWKNNEKEQNVFLVIEEINRGNCAQIFGDIFQLLDRNDNGESEYPIKADQDIQNYLAEAFADCDTLPENIKSGEELILPSNLYIWATMNTSDQSLFPIDSAFKRRWDWEYVPINYANGNWEIVIGNIRYSWVSFQKIVNKKVYEINHSEDKMLGDFFVKADDDDVITEKVLLNKILFYLWNDVCKDGEGDIFKKDANTDLTFSDLYGSNGTTNLIAMMEYLGVEKMEDDGSDGNDGTNSGTQGGSEKRPKYSINDSEKTYSTPESVVQIISDFAKDHPEMSVDEMIATWNRLSVRNNLLTNSYVKSPKDKSSTPRRIEINWNGKSVWVARGWTEDLFQTFIENVKEELGIKITKVN